MGIKAEGASDCFQGTDSDCNCTTALEVDFTEGTLVDVITVITVEILLRVSPGVVEQPKQRFTQQHLISKQVMEVIKLIVQNLHCRLE